ncbi:MAG: response regulator transcription factor [Tissierellia bacterium]|nr:response regulator transcription factor [Tissierellia bacterium]
MKKKIMVVEDNPIVRDYLVRGISDQPDFRVVSAIGNASDAVFQCQRLKIDIILMDIHTERRSSGLEASKRIKHDCPAVKIVLMTGLPTVHLIEEAKHIGVESFVAKDVSLHRLIQTLRGSLKGNHFYPY